MMIAVCAILAIICVILIIYIMIAKWQMKSICEELKRTRTTSYNRQLKVPLFDKDLEKLTAEINKNLDYQKSLKLETEMSKNRMKQSVSDIAHDLRTPLTVVKGNLFMLEREEELSERGREYVRVSIEKTDTLKEMVDDFFELSVLESDDSTVELKKIDATAFLAQFIIDNEAVIRQRGLTPTLSLPERSVFIKADETLLLRMLNNLLNNVLKYAKDEFMIELKNDMEKDGRTEIIFSNKLYRENDLNVEKLFDRTYRGNKARPIGGAGLGLYIVKLLAEKQGAAVSARTKDDNLFIELIFD